MHRIHTNDLAVERLKQLAASQSENRLGVLRNRIARAKATKLTVIAVVATERGDRTIAKAAREALALETGTKLADTYELVNSRRESHSKTVRELTQVLASAEDSAVAA